VARGHEVPAIKLPRAVYDLWLLGVPITTDSGKLLNLDCVEQIVAVGEKVTAMLPGERNVVSIVRASRVVPTNICNGLLRLLIRA